MQQTEKRATDEQLVLRAQANDTDATEEICRRYEVVVRSISRNFFLVGEEQEDVVQEGMLGLFSAVQGYEKRENGASFATFARHCIRCRIIDFIKASATKKKIPTNKIVPLFGLDDFFATETPEDVLIKEENRREFIKKMSQVLTPIEFKVATLYLDGFSYEEIAEFTKKSVKSIDNAMQRCRKKLRKLYEES